MQDREGFLGCPHLGRDLRSVSQPGWGLRQVTGLEEQLKKHQVGISKEHQPFPQSTGAWGLIWVKLGLSLTLHQDRLGAPPETAETRACPRPSAPSLRRAWGFQAGLKTPQVILTQKQG